MEKLDDTEDINDDKVLVCSCCYTVYSTLQDLEDHQCSNSSESPSPEPETSDGNVNASDSRAQNCSENSTNTDMAVYNDIDDMADDTKYGSSDDPEDVTDDTTDMFGPSMFHCVPCGHVFNEEGPFRNHTCRKRKLPRTYTCGMCGKSFQKACVLQAHMKIHYASKEFACKICSKTFLHKHQLVVHEVVHSNKRPFECDICDARFKRITHLRRHELAHTGQKSFSCDRCDYKSISTYAIRRHQMNVHTAERPFACSQCSCYFSEKYKLNAHIAKIHNSSNRSKRAKKHQRSMVQCLFCDKKFYWRKHLSTHLQSDHVEEFQKLSIKNEILENSHENGEGSSRSADLDFNPGVGSTSSVEHTGQDELARSKCWFCEKTFSRETGLIRHMKVQHTRDYKKACENTKSENEGS